MGSEAAAPPCSKLRKPLQPWSPAGGGPRALVLALQQKTFQLERIWVEPNAIVFTVSLSPVFLPLLSPWLEAGAGEGGQGHKDEDTEQGGSSPNGFLRDGWSQRPSQ